MHSSRRSDAKSVKSYKKSKKPQKNARISSIELKNGKGEDGEIDVNHEMKHFS